MVKRSIKETHSGRKWSFVGGKVENPSSSSPVLEQTLKREIKEEVDVEVENKILYLTSSFFITDNNDTVIDIIFFCNYKKGDLKIANTEELSEVEWMTSEEVLSHNEVMAWTKNYLKLAVKVVKQMSY